MAALPEYLGPVVTIAYGAGMRRGNSAPHDRPPISLNPSCQTKVNIVIGITIRSDGLHSPFCQRVLLVTRLAHE